MELDFALVAVAAGSGLIVLAAVLRAPSRPLDARTDAAALALLVGGVLLLWGIRALKRRRDERRRVRD
jgi:hypothetical protein